jgi:hypothetical protein
MFIIHVVFDLPLFIHHGRRFAKHTDNRARDTRRCNGDRYGNQRQHDCVLNDSNTLLVALFLHEILLEHGTSEGNHANRAAKFCGMKGRSFAGASMAAFHFDSHYPSLF